MALNRATQRYHRVKYITNYK